LTPGIGARRLRLKADQTIVIVKHFNFEVMYILRMGGV